MIKVLKTNLGEINVLINNETYNYKPLEMNKVERNFKVDGRYKLIVDIPKSRLEDIVVECKLVSSNNKIKQGINSGQQLALISLQDDAKEMSIGVEDEIPNVKYQYIDFGIRVIISKEASLHQLVFGIAWITMKDEEIEYIYTWFAADPTLFELY